MNEEFYDLINHNSMTMHYFCLDKKIKVEEFANQDTYWQLYRYLMLICNVDPRYISAINRAIEDLENE